MHKKGHKLKTSPLIKNPQFPSNLADIQAKLPTHEVVILIKFHKDCKKIIDFLLTLVSLINEQALINEQGGIFVP